MSVRPMAWGPHEVGGAEAGPERLLKNLFAIVYFTITAELPALTLPSSKIESTERV